MGWGWVENKTLQQLKIQTDVQTECLVNPAVVIRAGQKEPRKEQHLEGLQDVSLSRWRESKHLVLSDFEWQRHDWISPRQPISLPEKRAVFSVAFFLVEPGFVDWFENPSLLSLSLSIQTSGGALHEDRWLSCRWQGDVNTMAIQKKTRPICSVPLPQSAPLPALSNAKNLMRKLGKRGGIEQVIWWPPKGMVWQRLRWVTRECFRRE